MPRNKRNRPEQEMQKAVARLLRAVGAPETRWTAIERANSAVLGGIQKAMGANAGWPDMIFILNDGKLAAIEFKRPGGKGRTLPGQDAWQAMAQALPVPYALCTSVEATIFHLQCWGFPEVWRITFTTTNAPIVHDTGRAA